MTTPKPSMKEKLFDIVVNNVVSNAINIGYQPNLFKKLAEISSQDHPVLPEDLAKATDCKERYVREWANCLACGGILEVNEEEKFWIAKENVEDLTGDSFELVSNRMLQILTQPLDQLISCFKTTGPHGLEYSQFSEFADIQSQMSKAMHEKHVIPDMIPAIVHGIQEKLEAGRIRVLDVGCGSGFHSALLAEEYPKTQFVGLDIGEDAIKQAKDRKKKSGKDFENLEFIQCDAGKMPGTWTDSFDLVLIFDACHDQMRPDLCIQEIHRVLKPSGIFAMLEVDGTSNVFEDRKALGSMSALNYGFSLLHCLPVASNSPDAMCLGAMWGKQRAIDLLHDCGFPEVEVIETPYFWANILYLAKKD